MKQIVLLTNILSPYRKAFYEAMYEIGKECAIAFHVLFMNDTESNRRWDYKDFCDEYTQLLKQKVLFGKKDSLYINIDLVDTLEKLKPDILVLSGSYTFLPVWQALRWARKHSKCKVYFWSESHLDEARNYNKLKLTLREIVRKSFYSQIDGFWYPGQKAKELISQYAKSSVTYIQVPNLIENEKFEKISEKYLEKSYEIRQSYGLSLTKKIFFAPMRLTKAKGILPFLALINAMDISLKKKLQIVIAGEGELHDEIQAYITTNALDVILLGYRSNDEIGKLMCGSDVVFLSSISDPNPLTCIEALWCKKPLLVSKHVGNAPEVIEAQKNGFVFSYDDTRDAVQKIQFLLDIDDEWYREAALYSKKIAEEKFDLTRNTNRIIKQLSKIMAAQ